MNILLKPVGNFVEVNGQPVAKGYLSIIWAPDGRYLSLMQEGQLVYNRVRYSDVSHDPGTGGVAFATAQELRRYAELNFNELYEYAMPFRHVSTDGINATTIKQGTALVEMLQAINNSQSQRFIKIYDTAAAPSPGADEVPVLTLQVPAVEVIPAAEGGGEGTPKPAQVTTLISRPLKFYNGFSFVITGSSADSDETPITHGEVILSGAIR